MSLNNPNVAYNYQKTPGLITSDTLQSVAGLSVTLRNNPNYNRNLSTLYPVGQSTPNPGAGYPTMLALQSPKGVGEFPYAGSQVTYIGGTSG